MFTNKCIKCGKEFETKNPKRVICPDCLYPERNSADSNGINPVSDEGGVTQDYSRGYSAGSGNPENYQRRYNNQRPQSQGGYNQGYNNQRPRNNYQRRDNQGGYNQGYNNQNGYNRRPQRPNNFNRSNNFNNRRPQRPNKNRPLLIDKEQLLKIEEMYKKMLPLPNPDAHEVIAAAIELEPKKVFFGINLVRQKMMLPKIQFPKRKLAITPDQLMAIKNLYEPLLPLPPIGCHKILAAQLKMDEWRVHVGIGLVRKQMGLDRWNQEREDCPEEFKNKPQEPTEEVKKPVEEVIEKPVEEVKEEPKKRKPRAKKVVKEETPKTEEE